MEVLLGGITSILYGIADFLGGEAARKVNAATVVVWTGIISFPLLVVVAVSLGGLSQPSDYLIGAAAGVAGTVGLVTLFAGLSRSRAAAVAPVAAAVGAVVPVVVAVLTGDRPSFWAWVGVVIAVPAIALSAWADDDEGSRRNGLGYGAVAGVGFGGFAAIIGLTDPRSELLPLIAARGTLVLVVVLVGVLGLWKLHRLSAIPRPLIFSNAVLDVSANMTLVLALRAGSFALAAIAASFYPAVTVILAKLVNGEHLRRRQVAGILLTLLALGLIAVN